MNYLIFAIVTMLTAHAGPTASYADGGKPQVQASWAPADSADALWKKGRSAIADGNWDDAQDVFRQIHERYPKSSYTGDSYYWEAYALSQIGDAQSLRRAVRMLDLQSQRFKLAATYKSGEAKSLAIRTKGLLARTGDAGAARDIAESASAGSGGSSGSGSGNGRGVGCKNGDDDDRVEALNALLQMNSEQALPLLKKVMARRDPCSEGLRRKAVFLISQKSGDEAADLLMSTARNDPDAGTRHDAVFWLSQVPGEKSTTFLEEILKSSKDDDLQDQALFALSQKHEARAQETLRSYATRDDISEKLRDKAIFGISQQPTAANAKFLRDVFARATKPSAQNQILFALAQIKDQGNLEWTLEQAVNTKLPVEVRKQAVFWAGQSGASTAKIAEVYDKGGNEEFKNHVIFVLADQHSAAAVDKLISIAKDDKSSTLRKQAIFWLGQSRDPRAIKAIQEIIDR